MLTEPEFDLIYYSKINYILNMFFYFYNKHKLFFILQYRLYYNKKQSTS